MNVALFLMEVSNPFNIGRQNFKALGMNALSDICGIFFALTFLAFRLVFAPMLMYWINYNELGYPIKIECSFIHFVSLIWCFRIISLLCKALKEVSPTFRSYTNL